MASKLALAGVDASRASNQIEGREVVDAVDV
jgi:hypothetical protein